MKNKTILAILFGTITSISTLAVGQMISPLYWSLQAQQAEMSYSFHVDLESDNAPDARQAELHVDRQIAFLFGALANNGRPGVPKGQYEFQITSISPFAPNTFRIQYNYQGRVLIESGAEKYKFFLPLNPALVYRRGLQGTRGQVPCGDDLHPEEHYFWYFFNPTAPGCPLQISRDFDAVEAEVRSLPNTRETYPEYERLIRDGEIRVDLLLGLNQSWQSHDPLRSTDINAQTYRSLRNYLLRQGFQPRTLTPEELNQIFNGRPSSAFMEELVKAGPVANLKVRLFFGPTDMIYGEGFHYAFKNSLNESSVLIYGGHSGLGDYLDLERIELERRTSLEAPPDQYQIYFFNSCSSYPYYNHQYFSLKKTPGDPEGTKNLDIITNGLATLFSALAPSSLEVLKAVENYAMTGQRVSYQKMLTEADSRNLIGINGDEDNP